MFGLGSLGADHFDGWKLECYCARPFGATVPGASRYLSSGPLVWVATLGSMVSYLIVLGHRVFVVHGGLDAYYRSADRVPRTQELLLGLGLAVAGLLAGQSVRQAQRLVRGYPVAVEEPQEKAA